MKSLYHLLCFLLFTLILQELGHAQMTGSYTINPSSAASSTNYQTFASAVFDLTQSSGTRPDGGPRVGPGVSGPVTFLVSAGTYTEQNSMGPVTGASATNTITFTSANGISTSVVLQYTSTSSGSNYTFRLYGADYVTFTKMSLVANSSSYPIVVAVTNNGTDHARHNQIKYCRIKSIWGVSTSYGAITSNGNNAGLQIIGDTISNAQCGITISGNNSLGNYTDSMVIDSNLLSNYLGGSDCFYGMDIRYLKNLKMRYNVITKTGCCADKMGNLYYLANNTEIAYNKMDMSGGVGCLDIQYLNPNSESDTIKIYNNFFRYGGSGSGYVLKFYYCRNVWLAHNNIYHNGSNSGIRAVETYGNSASHINLAIVNNIISGASGTLVNVLGSTLAFAKSAISVLDHNVYNRGSLSQSIVSVYGTSYTNMSSILDRVYTGSDAGSLSTPISFVSVNNLHITTTSCIPGRNISFVSKDIDMTTRTNPPSIGAHENAGSRPNDDASVELITAPGNSFSPGLQDIKVRIRNNGGNTISSLNITYAVNGGTPVTQTLPSSLGSCDTTTITFTGANQYSFSAGQNILKVYTSSPNGNTDAVLSNDTLTQTFCSTLNGSYTLDGSLPASSTNFQNFSQLATALGSCGVSGPVTINVAAGTYYTQALFYTIPGNSPTNKVVIDGGDGNAATRIILGTGLTSSNPYVVRIDGISDISFRNLTFRSTDASNGFLFQALTGTNIRVKKCIFEFTGAAATSTSNNLAHIVTNAGGTLGSGQSNITLLEVDTNTFTAGAYGIHYYATSTSNVVWIRNNTYTNIYNTGIYMFVGLGKALNNTISMRNASSSYGIYYFASNPSSISQINQINGNKLYNMGSYGINIQSSTGGGSTAHGEIYNNMIGGVFFNTSNIFGLNLSSSTRWKIYHNSISVTSNSTTVKGIVIQGSGSQNRIRNNVISITSTTASTAYPVEITTSSYVDSLDYNAYHNTHNTTLIRIGSTNYTSGTYLASYPTGGGLNSKNGNPDFYSSSDLHSFGGLLNNVGMNVFIATDYDNESRGTSPDIGADEYSPVTSDASVFAINGLFPCPYTNDSIYITLKNYGTDSLSTVRTYYTLDGGTPDSLDITLSPKLAQGQTLTNVPIGLVNVSPGSHQLKVWVDYPNGVTDMNRLNDTSSSTFNTKLSGTYTVGGISPDYPDLPTVISIISSYGICGPVVLNIRPGTYSGPFTLDSIPGSSTVNTVTIQSESGNATDVVLTNNTSSSSSNNFTLNVYRADDVYIRNLTIQRIGSDLSYTTAIYLSGHTQRVKMEGLIISNPITNTSSTNKALVYHFVSGALHRLTDFTLYNSTLKGGSSLIYFVGNSVYIESNDSIYGNTFDSAYYTGIYRSYGSNLYIHNNTIRNFSGTTSSVYGMLLDNCKDSSVVSANRITGIVIGYGIYTNLLNGNSQQSVFLNNMISIGQYATSSVYGMYHNNPIKCYNAYNSIRMLAPNTVFNVAFYAYSNGVYTNNSLLNNNFTADNSGSNSYNAYITGNSLANSKALFNLCNYNNYYSASTFRNVVYTTQYTSFTSYRGAIYTSPSNNDLNSISTSVSYFGITDLRIYGSSLDSMGTPLSLYTTDIDGNTRNTVKSDLGCFEYAPTGDDVGVSAILSPVNPLTLGAQNISVTLKNYGASTLTSAQVEYDIAGTIKTVSWTGTLASGSSTTVTFSGSNQYTFTGSATIKAYAYSPNGNSDTISGNDTSSANVCPGISGNYTIDGTLPTSGSNFNTLAEAVNQLQCGLVGPVTFTFAAGTYADRILCSSVPGASSTNTITFDGGVGNKATRIIEYNSATFSDPYIVKIASTPYVTLKNLTIQSSGATNGWLVHIFNSNNCKVKNCNIVFTGSALTSASSNLACLVLNGSSQTITTTGTCSNNEIDSCFMNGGYYSIYTSLGSTSYLNYYRRDSMINAYNTVAYFNSSQTIKFNNNYLSPRTSYNVNDGLVLFNGNSGGSNYHEVKENVIVNAGYRGIYMATSSGGGSTKGQMHNNFIGGGFRNTSGIYGIYTTSGNWNIYHNSINMDLALSGSNIIRALYHTSSSGNNLVNNILAITSNATSTNVIPVEINVSSHFTTVDYNNYFNKANTNRIKIGSTTYTNSTYIAAYTSGGGLNSMDMNPGFLSSTNLHINDTNIEMSNRGSNLSISTDIDGGSRLSTPDIGADEYVPATRSTTGSYTVGSGCPTISGSAWHYLKDNNGNVIMAINPNGNNLGATCWGVYVNSNSGLRSDSTTIGTPGNQRTFTYLFDRNFYISPTTPPSSAVSVRFYCTASELQEMVDSIFGKYSQTVSFDSINITKYNGPNVNLFLGDNDADSVNYALLNSTAIQYDGSLYYMQISTNSFSEFVPAYTAESQNSPLPIENILLSVQPGLKDVQLNWNLPLAINAHEFVIERQSGGRQPEIIKTIPVNTPSASGTYQYIDRGAFDLLKGVLQYRVTAIKNMGVVSSDWVGVNNEQSIRLMPNPAGDVVVLRYTPVENARYQIFDTQGRLVVSGILQNQDQHAFDLKGLTSGLFFLVIMDGEQREVHQFIHQP